MPSNLTLPSYTDCLTALDDLALPMPVSSLHGQFCAFLCTGALKKGEAYLQSLMGKANNETHKAAGLILFQIFTISQQQMQDESFNFELLLPDDEENLSLRAQAFSEWCEGFTEGLNIVGIRHVKLDAEATEAIEHIREFAALDCRALDISEEDEKALLEITEFTRIAVLKLYMDFLADNAAETLH